MAVTLSTHTLQRVGEPNIALNQSTVQYLVKITTSGASHNDNNITTTFYIDGVKYTKTHKLPSNTTTTVVDKTVTITHNNDGTRSVTASFSTPTNISAGTMTGSKTLTLDPIPRYTTINSFTVSKRNETSLTFNWSTADTIDYVWYSTNNGSSWTGYDVADGTSGNFPVSGLSPNTTYTCKLRVRRKDSQLNTDSSSVSQTTNAVPTQSLADKSETTIKMNWSCDANVDYVWYSTNNGSNWTAVGSVSGTSGNYTISSLSANTSYNIKTRVRRSATQTTYDTSASSQTTYQYPYVSAVSSSNLTIGNSQTLTLYNPKGRNCTVYMKKDSATGTQLYSETTGGTSITFTPTASTLYSSIPSAKYGNCVYYCVYSNQHVSTSTGHKYIVNEAINAPEMASNSLTDTNTNIVNNLTGNSSKIVLNASTLLISVTASPKNNATISSIVINGSSRTVSNNTATLSISNPTETSYAVVITDSRGISTQTTVSIASGNVINYIPLTIVGVAKRNQPTDGKINISSSGKYYNGGFGRVNNTLTTKYNWRETGGSWQGEQTLTNTTSTGTHNEAQIQLSNKDYTKSYEIQFKAEDRLNTVTSTITVPKGNPVFWWNDDNFNVIQNLNVNGVVSTSNIQGFKNTTYSISSDPSNSFQTSLFGSNNTGARFKMMRAGSTSFNGFPAYSPSLVATVGDTHMFLTAKYSGENAYIGAGNSDKINWYKEIAWKSDIPSNSSFTLAGLSEKSYNSLTDKPTIPTVNNATLTIQKNGSTVKTFTANASSNVTANITVPTNTNELTNGAGFITNDAQEFGASGIWRYVKFRNGYALCIGKQKIDTAIGTGWGNIYSSGDKALNDFPFTFKEVPYVSYSPHAYNATAGGGGYSCFVAGGNASATTTNPGKVLLLRGAKESTSRSYSVVITAFGKWK